MKIIDNAKMKMGVFLRERKERAEERQAKKRSKALPPGAAPMAWCVLLTMVGVAALAGSTWMLLVFIAGSVGHFDWYSVYTASQDGVSQWEWSLDSSVHWHVAIGLFLFCLAIAIFNATWLEARKHLYGVIQNVVTGIGIAVALFMISGAIVVQQRGTDARARDNIVAAQSAQVDAAAARERLETARQTLREMRNHENQYMAVAASVGAAEFERSYLSEEALAGSSAARRDLLVRSLGAARRADALETEIAQLERETATAAVTAVEAEAVDVRAGGFMAAPTAFLEDARKPITATLGELLALTAFGFALAAWRSRRTARDVERSGWADEGHRIEDMTDQPSIVPEPMEPAREVVTDAETGEELVKIKPKAYWRKRVTKKGKPTKVRVEPDVQDDEPAAREDGGGRRGLAVGPNEFSDNHQDANTDNDAERGGERGTSGMAEPDADDQAEHENEQIVHPEPSSDLSEEEAAELLAAADAPIVAADEEQENADSAEPDQSGESEVSDAHLDLPDGEGVAVLKEDEREPEARPERLLAAE